MKDIVRLQFNGRIIHIHRMIEAATFGNAYSNRDEDIIGTLEVGKL